MVATTPLLAVSGHGLLVPSKPNHTNKEKYYFKLASSSRSRETHSQIIHWRCRSSHGSTSGTMTMTTTMAATVVPAIPAPSPTILKRRNKKQDEDDEEWMGHLAPDKLEVLAHLEPWAEANVLPLLKPADEAWQPSDLLPDPATLGADGFHAACLDLRARAAGVPDAHLVCLVGNMITEEALPTYQSVPNRFEAVRDLTGADGTAWARWIRGWSAEENRHGDALSRYLYLSGRVDVRAVERTVHRLIAAGMAMRAARSAYHGFVYVAFQERATATAHANTARLAAAVAGDACLARVCGAIAADEKRHEAAYTRVVGKLFEVDPDAAVRAFGYMMRRRITMPAALMDGDGDLYAHYAAAAQQAGVYTASDYRGILEHLIRRWKVEELAAGLSGEGRRARDYVCGLPDKIRRMEEKALDRAAQARKKPTPVPFSWIFDRPVSLVLP